MRSKDKRPCPSFLAPSLLPTVWAAGSQGDPGNQIWLPFSGVLLSQTHKGISDDSVTEGRRELREVPMTEGRGTSRNLPRKKPLKTP